MFAHNYELCKIDPPKDISGFANTFATLTKKAKKIFFDQESASKKYILSLGTYDAEELLDSKEEKAELKAIARHYFGIREYQECYVVAFRMAPMHNDMAHSGSTFLNVVLNARGRYKVSGVDMAGQGDPEKGGLGPYEVDVAVADAFLLNPELTHCAFPMDQHGDVCYLLQFVVDTVKLKARDGADNYPDLQYTDMEKKMRALYISGGLMSKEEYAMVHEYLTMQPQEFMTSIYEGLEELTEAERATAMKSLSY